MKIYALVDPETQQTRYVGFTSRGLRTRLKNHIRDARYGKIYHKTNWLRSLFAKGLLPEIRLLERVTKENWQERERYWIGQFSNLTNCCEGGGMDVEAIQRRGREYWSTDESKAEREKRRQRAIAYWNSPAGLEHKRQAGMVNIPKELADRRMRNIRTPEGEAKRRAGMDAYWAARREKRA